MRKLFQGLSGGAWGVLIGKWMRERVSVLEVEETANVVFAFSEEAGSGEPNPGLRPKRMGVQTKPLSMELKILFQVKFTMP